MTLDELIQHRAPSCKLGYTEGDISVLFGLAKGRFQLWMTGQTGSICDGYRWNPDTEEHEWTLCGPHGCVYYTHDVLRFINCLPITD